MKTAGRLFVLLVLSCFFTTSLAQKNLELRSFLAYPGKNLNDIWGYADSAGREYALTGLRSGVSIVEVTDPDSITKLHFIPGPQGIWRDLKTWGHHAYVTNETSGGLLIIDLANLPAAIDTTWWTGPGDTFNTAHNIFIDEAGFAYLFGYQNGAGTIAIPNRGALILDLRQSPENPTVAGAYTEGYIHDGFVRGDTLWGSEIYNGYFSVVDVSTKSNSVVLATHFTPHRQTHNCWLSDDGAYLYTTDETAGAYIAGYDVRQLNNIEETDRYQAMPGRNIIPHNTFTVGDFLVNSYYTSGVTIVDATRPGNLVETGAYDTSPLETSAFNGGWGVYPYLPSGNILASDIEEGLFVLTPHYRQGCYLEGQVTDDSTGFPLNDIRVEIMGDPHVDHTGLTGRYATGVADSGTYDIRFYKSNCFTKIISGVALKNGQVTTLNTTFTCDPDQTGMAAAEARDNAFRVFPTIAAEAPTVFYQIQAGPFAHYAIRLHAITGQVMKHYPVLASRGEIELPARLPAGWYLVALSNGETRSVQRFFLTR